MLEARIKDEPPDYTDIELGAIETVTEQASTSGKNGYYIFSTNLYF